VSNNRSLNDNITSIIRTFPSCALCCATFNMLFHLFLGYLTTLTVASLYSVEWTDDRRMMIWKGFRRKRSWPEVLCINLYGGTGENHKTSDKVTDDPTKIRTADLPNKIQECYRYTNLFASNIFYVYALSSWRIVITVPSVDDLMIFTFLFWPTVFCVLFNKVFSSSDYSLSCRMIRSVFPYLILRQNPFALQFYLRNP
jgi:hypothetical protein